MQDFRCNWFLQQKNTKFSAISVYFFLESCLHRMLGQYNLWTLIILLCTEPPCACWERPILCFSQCDDCTYEHISVGSMLLKHNSMSPTQGTRAGCISHFWVEFFWSFDSLFIMFIHLGCSSAFKISTWGVTVLVRYDCSQPLEWTCIHNIAWCPMLSKIKS